MTPRHSPDSRPYREGVGIMLINDDGRVFVGRRAGIAGDAWQMPQGGIDPGEMPRDAALRELAEEVGTTRAEIIGESRGWLVYDLPPELAAGAWGGRYRGQRQKWFAMRFTGSDEDIRLDTHDHPEFDRWRWIAPGELPQSIIAFKRPLYEALLEEFRDVLKRG